MTLKELRQALDEISRWLDWDTEMINDFHTYAQRFGGDPGSNVYTFVLTEALRGRGLTLEQFREKPHKGREGDRG